MLLCLGVTRSLCPDAHPFLSPLQSPHEKAGCANPPLQPSLAAPEHGPSALLPLRCAAVTGIAVLSPSLDCTSTFIVLFVIASTRQSIRRVEGNTHLSLIAKLPPTLLEG